MRTLLCIKKNSAKISLLLLAVVITSCNSLKRVDASEVLIKKNAITADGEKVINEDIQSLIIQKPNSTLLGYPLRLNLYNLAKPNPDSSFQNWLHRKEKREKRLNNFLSKKQTQRLGQSFLVKGLSGWLKNIGELPSTLDTTKTRRTLERFRAYYASKGYLNATTTYIIDTLKKKQHVKINYQITKGEPYVIDSLTHNISSIAIDSLYYLNKGESFIKAGKQFNYSDFNKELKRLSSVFKNNGIYNFQESSIKYDIARDSTKTSEDKKMEVQLNISDLKIRGDTTATATTAPYKVFKFDNINIYTDYFTGGDKSELQFERYKNYTIYYRDKLHFKPKTLTDAIFFTKDSVYRDLNKIRTYRQITNLNVFKYPSITFAEDSTQTNLTANVYLTSKPKYSFRANLDVTQSSIQTVGLAFSPTLQARNLFKGAENLSISARLNIGASRDNITITDNQFFNLLEFGADINLDFPRIWFPLLNINKFIPNYMLPRTRISIGGSSQQNIGLDKQTFNTVLSYNWTPSDFTRHNIELLNIEFVRNLNTERFFNVFGNTFDSLDEIANNFDDVSDFDNPNDFAIAERFFEPSADTDDPTLRIINTDPVTRNDARGFIDAILDNEIASTDQQRDSVSSIEERRIRLTEDNLIFASNYTFNRNNRKGPTDNNFYQFRFKFESAGNFLSALSNIIPFSEEDDRLLVLGVPYSQYVKTEFDYVKYWQLQRSNALAFRSFLGIAIPYGNSDNIPFVRSYFAGGSNDNRAWRPYTLGPGRTNAVNDFNEANLKIALNLEYRFPLAGSFKGALFADAGNIWNVFDNVDDPEATFNGISSLKDIALGTGFGIRYDFTYFIVRADIGFRTYDPSLESSRRWFRDYNFANSVFNIGINYPF